MSFADIAATTDQRAEIFSFTEAERKRILSATQSLPISAATTDRDTFRKLDQLRRRETAWALHSASLAEYIKAQRIPRGLRVSLRPALFKEDQEFVAKWNGILNKCSLDLMTLTVQQLQSGLKEVRQQVHILEEPLKSGGGERNSGGPRGTRPEDRLASAGFATNEVKEFPAGHKGLRKERGLYMEGDTTPVSQVQTAGFFSKYLYTPYIGCRRWFSCLFTSLCWVFFFTARPTSKGNKRKKTRRGKKRSSTEDQQPKQREKKTER
eukprot:XP_017953120.1 PREDICTED: uncharacterized protein LOC108648909 [Xenopus tropicalis]